jgi:crotonobetainyl-CoA:carnitine CoA-transferase CaiB-like acyl-CoA transferase
MVLAMGTLLEGLRVLDLSLWQPGHTATQLLADLGADVVKVEPPGGDRMRPLVDRFVNFNGRKRSVVLDLKTDGDRGAFLDLVRGAEVVVENSRPGVIDRLGIGYAPLRAANPAVVLCSISGFGQTGPLASATGHDANYQAYAGAFTMATDAAPIPSALLVGDQGSGLAAAFAILAAVLCARRTGEGEHIDVSMGDLLASWVAPAGAVDPARERGHGAPRPAGPAPAMGTFRTRDDQWVVLGVFSEDRFWDDLCRALGLDHAVGMGMAERSKRGIELRGELAIAIATWDRAPLVVALSARSVPVAPVLTRAQMLEHPHFHERGTITTAPDGLRAVGHPIRYAVHPALPPGAPPGLDEHRDEILGPRTRSTP